MTGLSWSPDGRRLAVVVARHWIVLLSAPHPEMGSDPLLTPPPHCGYVAAAWTVTGLFTSEDCGLQGVTTRAVLAQLSPAGRVTASWHLPGCPGSDLADFTHRRVLIQAFIGHFKGGSVCSATFHATRLLTLRGAALRTLTSLNYDDGSDSPQVLSW